MNKKIKKIQIIRHLTQLILLFLSPGLFILVFGELKNIYEMVLKGNLNFLQALPSIIEFVSIISVTIVLGRFFCGWICAFGAFNDFLHILSKKVFKINFKANEKVDKTLKNVKYIMLLFIIVLMWTLGSTIFQSSSPWDAFAQITSFPQVLSDYTVGVILLVLIAIGAFFIERFFCRYLCPLGAVFNIVSRISIFKIKKPNDKCGKCRLCTSSCTMGLPLYKVNSVCGGDCINCLMCVETCPRKNTQANILGENINPALASSVAIAAVAGVYAATSIGGTVLTNSGFATSSNIAVNGSINAAAQKYKDGTYTGTGTGFSGGTTKLEVKVQNSKIINIQTLSTDDTPNFYQRAESIITNEIISSQSASVDTVSGATYSSRGIIEAVNDALKQAEVASTGNKSTPIQSNIAANTNNSTASSNTISKNNNAAVKSNTAVPSNETRLNNTSTSISRSNTTTNSSSNNTKPSTNTNTSGNTGGSTSVSTTSKYKNGTFIGTGTGFRGGITKISVTFNDDKIVSIQTISTEDTPRFYQNAEGMIINEMISAQSASVDTVSGATYSSRGIIGAVEDAISQAKL